LQLPAGGAKLVSVDDESRWVIPARANVIGLTVYNKWHETELERWLSDHGMDE
jgi:hypothetical protein